MDRYFFKNLKFKNWHDFCYAISMPNDAVRHVLKPGIKYATAKTVPYDALRHKKLFSRFLKIGIIFAIPKTVPAKTHLAKKFPIVKITENSKTSYSRDTTCLSILDLSGVEASPVESSSVGLFG